MRYITVTAAVGLFGLVLAGCAQQSVADQQNTDIDQNRLCQVSTWKPVAVADRCEPGQKILFRPGGEGNPQDAALFAAANCDLRYAVASSAAGTACIYRPIRSASALSSGDDDEQSITPASGG